MVVTPSKPEINFYDQQQNKKGLTTKVSLANLRGLYLKNKSLFTKEVQTESKIGKQEDPNRLRFNGIDINKLSNNSARTNLSDRFKVIEKDNLISEFQIPDMLSFITEVCQPTYERFDSQDDLPILISHQILVQDY